MRIVLGYDGRRPQWSEPVPSTPAAPLRAVLGGVDLGHAIPFGPAFRVGRKRTPLERRRADGRATPEEMQASRLRGNAAMQAAKAARK